MISAELRRYSARVWASFVSLDVVPMRIRSKLLGVGGANVAASARVSSKVFLGGSRGFTLGADTFLNRGTFIDLSAPVCIGDGTHLGPDVMILTSSHLWTDEGVGEVITASVNIGANCWIGARATVLPGVTIGDHVLIAAGAVVTKDLLSPGTYGGVPARLIGGVH